MLDKFIKTYSGSYKCTTMLRHKGVVIAFAMDKGRKIWYTILNLGGKVPQAGTTEKETSFLDVGAWQASPTELIFPNEIAEIGFGVAGQTSLPVFKKNGQMEPAGTILSPDKADIDYFKSTTARLTADAPFQVLSDGRYVYVFRQAISAQHLDMAFKLDQAGNLVQDKDGKQVPLVDSTLLVDRFLLVGTTLAPKMEVRYQRSRNKTRPASRKDNLGAKDLDGNVFYEPTQELKFVGNLKDGHFSVLLLPTAIAEVQRWQIFAENSVTHRMDCYNVERSDDGLFNTRGSQSYTCVNHPQVYTRKAGTCPECGKTLTLRLVDKGFSESAMKFDGVDDFVKLGIGIKLDASFTQEAWILPNSDIDDKFHGFLGTQPEGKDNCHRPPSVWVYQKRKIHAGFGDGVYWYGLVTKEDVLIPGKWNHVALTFDGMEYKVYVNGEEKEYDVSVHKYDPPEPVGGTSLAGKVPCDTPIQFIGKVDNCFDGVIDEVRIWKRARAQQEILDDLHHRLTGLEPDLVGYWRFDEGYGYTIHDQTNNRLDGTSYYDENRRTYKDIKWIQSDAPVGEHPGIERTSFEIKGRSFTSAPTSLLYYQQSKAASGYSGEAKPLKNTGRVMLAVATNDGSVENTGKNHIAALDFGVSATGRLAQIPDEVALRQVNAEGFADQSLNAQLDNISGLQAELVLLNSEISRLEDSIACLQPLIEKLDQALRDPAAITGDVTDGDYTYLNPNLIRLKELHRDFTTKESAKTELDNNLANATLYVYEHVGYNGRSLGPLKGFIDYGFLQGQGFNDIISSIWFNEPLQVVVYEHGSRGGMSKVFSESTSNVGGGWNDKISSLEVQENPNFMSRMAKADADLTTARDALGQAKQAVDTEKTMLGAKLSALQGEKNLKEGRRMAVKDDLSKIQDEVKNGASATMPRVRTDPLGLTISGGLLGFGWTDDAPFLFDSATGTLALYFRGTDDQFFVAYYSTFTARASLQLDSTVTSIKRSTDPSPVTINISDGQDEATCEVVIKNAGNDEDGEIVEKWINVPRAAAEFARVLNGQANGRAYIGSGQVTGTGELTLLGQGARRAINKGDTLLVGDMRIETLKQIFPGDTIVPFKSSSGLQAETLPVYYVEYDYPINARCKNLPADLSNGSTLIYVLAGSETRALVPNKADGKLTPTDVCKWTAAAPGSTLAFDGRSQVAEPEDTSEMSAMKFDGVNDYIVIPQNKALNIEGSITIEAWIKPEAIDGTRNIVAHGYPYTSTGELVLRMEDEYYEIGVWRNGNHLARIPIPEQDGKGLDWIHLAGVYDAKNRQWILYRNGVAGASNVTDNGPDPIEADWGIGANANPQAASDQRRCFKGAIDEVRVWKRARTEQEIQTDMNRRLIGNETDLVGYWHFENGKAKDYTHYQINGTVKGSPIQAVSPLPAVERFDAEGDLTLEAWVRPTRVESRARVIQHNSAKSRYMLALEKSELMSALTFDGVSCIDLGTGVKVGATFTQEAWIFPAATDENYHGFLGDQPDKLSNTRPPSLWTKGKRLHAGFGDGKCWNSLLTKNDVLILNTWNHIAITFDGREYKVYVNGEKKDYDVSIYEFNPISLAPTIDLTGRVPCASPIKYIGMVDNHFIGAIDDVRIWKRARTRQEIQTDMNRRLNGNETDLVGYWHFEDGKAKDYTKGQVNGAFKGNPVQAVSPLSAYTPVAGVGDKVVMGREVIPAGNWTHLVAAFDQAYGVELDGGDHLDCGNDSTLDISQDLTIEAFLQVTSLRPELDQVIIRRGTFDDAEAGQHVPYSFSLHNKQLKFSFEDIDGKKHEYASAYNSTDGLPVGFHKVAVTRERKTSDESTGTQQAPSVNVTVWDEIRFYVDGSEAGLVNYESAQLPTDTFRQPVSVGNSNKKVIIGENLYGTITEVRVWNTARVKADIGKSLTGNEKGLVSWWRLQEGAGSKAFDSKSQNHATIHGASWVKSPDPLGSSLKMYINGQPKDVNVVAPAAWTTGDDQFMLGGRKLNSKVGEYFQGELEDVRIWQTTRTEEQIQDNLFRRVQGEKEDLIAYYTFDEVSDGHILDCSLCGNQLTLTSGTSHVFSTAPIGNDTPQVRSALAGVRTPFSGKIGTTPAIQEYGDMQYDSQGNLIGVFKRCYSYILDGTWQIITGYKVGDMITEWIGQVQFAPELIGFIEGAPPVPSENLTMKSVEQIGDMDDYNQASIVEIAEAEQTTHTYAASRDTGFDMAVDFSIGLGPSLKIYAGLGVEKEAFGLDWSAGLKGSFEHSLGWLENASTSVSRSTGKTTSLELRGCVGTDEKAEPVFKCRFMPDNTGLALVKSETADIYALRLRHNGALIAYQMKPNPDIPKDWNLIHFPINPRYTKQGTLDGKVGLSPDIDYPNALTYSPSRSYFRPIEAYALKDRIHREELQLRTYYEQYAAGAIGRRQAALHFSEQDLAAGRMLEKLPNLNKCNLVNTYVWTADGGLFAETEETMDSQQEMIGGSYAFTGKGGLYVDFNTAGATVGFKFVLDALFGGHLNLSVTKTQESSSSFKMNVNLDKVERDIYKRDAAGVIQMDASNGRERLKPIKQPGKVDAYRFMSFFLEPQSGHFDDFFHTVVDPTWLEQSDDPGAVALRAARDDNKAEKPAPWRAMHRVTYVSRILPPLDLSAPPSLEKTLQTLDIDSNYELLKQLEPHVRDHLTDFSKFSLAVDDALKSYLPELIPHSKEIKEYLSLYFGIDEGYMPEPQVEGLGDGSEFRRATNRPPVVKAGQYPNPLLLAAAPVSWTPVQAFVSDDRVKNEDLFLTWEFIPRDGQAPEDVRFGEFQPVEGQKENEFVEDPHKEKVTVWFEKKGQHRLRFTASDGILSASDETVIVVNEAPVIESISAGKPARSTSGELFWTVELECRLKTGLGDPSRREGLIMGWLKKSGSDGEKLEIVSVTPKEDDEGILMVKTTATFQQSGHYLLEFGVNNGIPVSSQINLEIAARVTDGLQALYTFEAKSGTTVSDVSGLKEPLDLVISNPNATNWNGGLKVHAPALLSAEGKRIAAAIKKSGEITLEAWIKPEEENEPGLRRILTLSNGPAARDFILAQSGHTYHAGLRTTYERVTDMNASLKSIVGGAVNAGQLSHIVFTRNAGGEARLYINKVIVASRLVGGDFSKWEDGFQLALGNEFMSDGDPDRAWSGEYHLVAIYDRALTPEEIEQNYEFGADRDLPPHVSAGEDREINWSLHGVTNTNPEGRLIVKMHGRVTHDRPIFAGSIEWSQVGGPKDCVQFANDEDPATEAYFSRSGLYLLRLTANDGKQTVSREVKVKVTHEFPRVKINIADLKLLKTGGINTVTLLDEGTTLALGGVIQNSQGEEYPTGKLKVAWTCGGKLIANALDAAVTFTRNGVCELTLTATNTDDESLTASDSLTVTVNQAPIVDAGTDQVIILPGKAILDATISDDGLPVAPGILELTWTGESENSPGKAEFANPKADYTTVGFTDKGTYALKLAAFDGAAACVDMVRIIVNKAPVVDAGDGAAVKYKASIPLNGVIEDDGFGNEDQRKPITISWKWKKEDGCEEPTFGNPDALKTTVEFPKKGVYVLEVTANNGYASGSDAVTFTVNEPPRISFGGKRSFSKNSTIELVGVIDDDGLGDPEEDMGKIGVRWEQTKGPTATIDNKTILNPKVKILQGKPGTGTYEFTLTVTNPSFSPSGTSATIEIKVD